MRYAAIALVVLLTGCTATPIFTAEENADLDSLTTAISQVDGIDETSVVRFPGGDGRDTELTVTLDGVDPQQLESQVLAVTELIADAPFDGDHREIEVYLRDSNNQFSMSAEGGEPLPTERIAIFSRWMADPRVSDISWHERLELSLVPDGVTDDSLETIYAQLADDVTLDGGGLSIDDPGVFSIATAHHPFTAERFAVAREIAALEGVTSCTFELVASSDGSFMHRIYCSVLNDVVATGNSINELLDARGLLESTEVRLQTIDDSVLTHEGSYVTREG